MDDLKGLSVHDYIEGLHEEIRDLESHLQTIKCNALGILRVVEIFEKCKEKGKQNG